MFLKFLSKYFDRLKYDYVVFKIKTKDNSFYKRFIDDMLSLDAAISGFTNFPEPVILKKGDYHYLVDSDLANKLLKKDSKFFKLN